ncbi:MAG TPA: NAD(P)-binding domain-containing protein [Kofleriaceae bacterium]|jgi:3-hydroxyisobutyrate dehydrogenase-like beta-hydroxyacid dehydrogenase|nr:NAD(P)-binding domain-containing protein [Kofleriaceae bacterium]
MSQIAFLGTGLLGAAFVQGLLARGTPVTCWSRTSYKTVPLGELGAQVAATPAEAVAGASRVHICVKDDEAVDAVIAKMIDAIPPDAVIIDHTTVSPGGAAQRGEMLASRGLGFVHAPCFMSPAAAKSGGGMMLAAGPRAAFAKIEDALHRMTGDLWYLGEDPRRAAGMKLMGNAMLVAIAAGLADTITIGAGLGITSKDAHGLLARMKPGSAIDVRGRRMAEGDYDPTFELTMARKDMGLMLDAAGDRPLAALAAIAARADALIERGLGTKDLGVLAVDVVPSRT